MDYYWCVLSNGFLSARARLMSIDDDIFFVKIELWIVCFLRRLNINVLIFTNHYYDVYWRMLNHCVHSHCPAKIPKTMVRQRLRQTQMCWSRKKQHISFKILCHIVITCNLYSSKRVDKSTTLLFIHSFWNLYADTNLENSHQIINSTNSFVCWI